MERSGEGVWGAGPLSLRLILFQQEVMTPPRFQFFFSHHRHFIMTPPFFNLFSVTTYIIESTHNIIPFSQPATPPLFSF
jgi:hypothetical protein